MTSAGKTWPRPSGPYAVGVTQFDLTDPRRVSTFAPGPLPGRRIDVHVWYPALAGSEAVRRRYMSPRETSVLNFGLCALMGQDPGDLAYLNGIETFGYLNAPPRADLSGLPVVVFTHGAFSHALQNTALMETLASQGYVVLSLAHPHESGGVVYGDGSAVTIPKDLADQLNGFMIQPGIMENWVGDDPFKRLAGCADMVGLFRGFFLYDMLAAWVEDGLFVVDALRDGRWPTGLRALTRIVDPKRIGYCGMSYGGAVSLRLSQLDPYARAAISLDGGFWTWDAFDRHAPTPFLFLGADSTTSRDLLGMQGLDVSQLAPPLTPQTPNFADPALEPLHEAGLRPDIVRVSFPETRHLSFTDMPLTHRPEHLFNATTGPLAGGPEVEAINRFCLDFLDSRIMGKPNGFPDSAFAAHPYAVKRDLTEYRQKARRERRLG